MRRKKRVIGVVGSEGGACRLCERDQEKSFVTGLWQPIKLQDGLCFTCWQAENGLGKSHVQGRDDDEATGE